MIFAFAGAPVKHWIESSEVTVAATDVSTEPLGWAHLKYNQVIAIISNRRLEVCL